MKGRSTNARTRLGGKCDAARGQARSYYGETREEVETEVDRQAQGRPGWGTSAQGTADGAGLHARLAARHRWPGRQTTHVRYERAIPPARSADSRCAAAGRAGTEHLQRLYARSSSKGSRWRRRARARGVLAELARCLPLDLVARQATTLVTPPRMPRTHVMRVSTAPEARRFLGAAKETSLPCPVRAGTLDRHAQEQLLALRWQDVDMDRGVVRIQQAVVQAHGTLTVSDPKRPGAADRLPYAAAIQALRQHRSWQAR